MKDKADAFDQDVPAILKRAMDSAEMQMTMFGSAPSVIFFVSHAGENVVAPLLYGPEDEERILALAALLLRSKGARSFVLVAECWYVKYDTDRAMMSDRERPRDSKSRREGISATYVSRGVKKGAMAEIIRDEGGKFLRLERDLGEDGELKLADCEVNEKYMNGIAEEITAESMEDAKADLEFLLEQTGVKLVERRESPNDLSHAN